MKIAGIPKSAGATSPKLAPAFEVPQPPPAAKGPSISGLRGLTVAGFRDFSPLISIVQRGGVSFRGESNFWYAH